MKLWEILPQLKEGQTINVTYKDGHKDTFTCINGTIHRAENGFIMTLHREHIEAEFELIPQPVPFEVALKALREGKTVRCESKKYGCTHYALDDGDGIDLVSEILEGTWYICS